MIDRLGAVGGKQFFDEVTRLNSHPTFYGNRLYLTPSNKELSLLLFKKCLARVETRILGYLYFEQWCILFGRHPDIATSLRRFAQIVPPRDRFWADPNVIYRNDSYYIYIEEFIYARDKGHISLIVMDRKGKHGKPISVINEPHHLSYPFVFEYERALYMLAEASQARSVPLYRCISFPDKWIFERNLFEDIEAVDPTLLFHNGKWFLFLGVAENRGSSSSDELFLYFSDNPISGTWTSHPLNPIISDVKKARPGCRRMLECIYRSKEITTMLLRGKNPISETEAYASRRGMSWSIDVTDWIGGLPFEFASVDEVFRFCTREFGFQSVNLESTISLGCNQFLFRRPLSHFPAQK